MTETAATATRYTTIAAVDDPPAAVEVSSALLAGLTAEALSAPAVGHMEVDRA